ncbi:MAG: Gfo/Idh/MocA family oxidoreductase [Pirellulaceae bacterium]
MSENERTTHFRCPTIAVVGCGAAAREFCLPLLRRYPGSETAVVLVDHSQQQADSVGREFGFTQTCTDYRCLPFAVDAAVVMTPHNLHAEQATHFLRSGCHVFVEKPMAMSPPQSEELVASAASCGRILMVNNYRRLFPSYQRVRQVIQSGTLGKIDRVSIRDGTEFGWNSASSFYFRDPSVRGVLLDRGAHTIDVINWWLGKSPRVAKAEWDAHGGIDARMDVLLNYEQTEVSTRFGRFYRLANDYRIECEDGMIKGRLFDFSRLSITRHGVTETVVAGPARSHTDYAWQLLENFIDAVSGRAEPLFLAADVAPSIRVIDEAYQLATRFNMPWYDDDPNIAMLTRRHQPQHTSPSHRDGNDEGKDGSEGSAR